MPLDLVVDGQDAWTATGRRVDMKLSDFKSALAMIGWTSFVTSATTTDATNATSRTTVTSDVGDPTYVRDNVLAIASYNALDAQGKADWVLAGQRSAFNALWDGTNIRRKGERAARIV